jgi:ATP-binding cassette subfamily B protein
MAVGAARRVLVGTALGRPGLPMALAAIVLVVAAAQVVFPAAIAATVNSVIGREPAGGPVLLCVACLVALLGGEVLAGLVGGFWAADATKRLRAKVVRHVAAAGVPSATDPTAGGDAVSRVVGGTTVVASAGPAVLGAAASVIPVVGSVIALVMISPWLLVTLAVSVPFVTILIRRFVSDSSAIAHRYQKAQGNIAGRLLDARAGLRTILAANTTEREITRILAPLDELRAAGDQRWLAQGVVASRSALLAPLIQIAVLATGGYLVTAHRITPGDLLAASGYAMLALGFGSIVGALSRVAEARAAAGRLAEILVRPAVDHGDHQLPPGSGKLEFDLVTLVLDGKPVLRDLTFTIPAGRSAAVVGTSGSGKSLVAALAGRLLDPDRGQIRLDGLPLPMLRKEELREAVTYAFERPALVGDTLGQAIDFGPKPVTPERIWWAAGSTQMDTFIRRLPNGFDTPLGPLPLSGGERQRLGLARAFAHAQRLLILDDATSSLDMVTEMQIDAIVTSELAGCTRLIIAHRLSTVARADLVVWIDDGAVRAVCPHTELWPADPKYRALFDTGGEFAPGPGSR